ncbi:hypothetical protein Afil01_41510 [Actinorhabdospora filicis]|uniref:AB hydrolase-1 domain-containing protein n=1 Tax=Actinorhabdospora filicis TaxID=1785913 RepID=A0A9W6SNX9_9ACTN|nr:alpha/beta hydrolase [Actinorhabdospora filicis]GLZ79344.1 hypothetical protein Afil01_41510 [Actinorhabdospora filicis]
METVISANGVDICVETFGSPADPAILLVGGAASSMDWWEADFCQLLAQGDGGRFVIRYDLRDTGRSVSHPAGEPGYTGEDLVGDITGVLDALGIARVHLVGLSMGGGMAQRVAVDHPGRLLSLTLMSTSPGGPGGPEQPDLPAPTERIQKSFSEPAPEPDWSDREAVVEYVLASLHDFAGGLGVDEARSRATIGRMYDRTTDFAASQTNHWILEGNGVARERLSEITVPTLVAHGSDDPLFPLGHGEALAREIPGARLLVLAGGGHEFPPAPVWDVLVPALLEHTRAG